MLIVGVGNPDRGDDGVGAWVAERLAAQGRPAIACRGETTQLMDAWAGHDHVIVVDAMRSGVAPGTLRRIDAHDGPFPTQAFTGSTHSFGLAEAIELARALGSLPPRLVVYGIEGARFDIGTSLSEPALQAARDLVEELSNA